MAPGLKMADHGIADRWASLEKDLVQSQSHKNSVLWSAVCRDDVLLSEVSVDDNVKIPYAGRRLLRKEKKPGFEFYTYTITSKGQKRRFVRGIKFHVYERLPLPIGSRARLRHLEIQDFLNGETVRIVDYDAAADKYMIRPTVPLPEDQKLSTTGKLLVKSHHLVPMAGPQEAQHRVWTFACLFDSEKMQEKTACQFIEKIVMISEAFRSTREWQLGKELSCQELFAPVLQAQMENFQNEEEAVLCLDSSLEFSRNVMASNMKIMQDISLVDV